MIKKLSKKGKKRNIRIPFYEKDESGMIYFGIAAAGILLSLVNGLIVAHNADKKHLDHA
ncbi:MAG: hypothetical protein K6E13_10270 [Lachnospiraceae bacterium]|nr:hypothetical protein [Lachnospiraceae bacterium]